MIASFAALAAGVPRAGRAQTAPVRIGVNPIDSYPVVRFAQDRGYFSDAGLDVQLTTILAGLRMMEAMSGNDIDVATADVIQLGNAFNHGLPFAIFATTGLYKASNPQLALCVARTSSVQTAKDLQDQPIGCISLTSLTTLSLREWLRQGGADATRVKLVEMPYPLMAPALVRGTVAAALLAEPVLTMEKDVIRILTDPFTRVGSTFYVGCEIAKRDWIVTNRDVARRVARALFAAAAWANDHHDEASALMAKYSNTDVEQIRTMTRPIFATSLDPRLLQPPLDIAYRYGVLTKPVRAEVLVERV